MGIGILVLFSLFAFTQAAHKCVWVKGRVQCKKNPLSVLSTEIRLYDRDGKWAFRLIDSDDLMGLTVPDQYGNFTLEGCGNDFDWLPFKENDPEPYISIFHYCNSADGQERRYPEFKVFVPETYRPAIFVLDD